MDEALDYYIVVREIPKPPVRATSIDEAIRKWREINNITDEFRIMKVEWCSHGFKVILEYKKMPIIPEAH